ncbi:MAG TPA: methyl-accepting chemotaxis protein [Anaeromyxobacteraceae bacterium]|nr:methyl-accepting chemotaxis protein [Anaeromyxobacteraceae bacterium]
MSTFAKVVGGYAASAVILLVVAVAGWSGDHTAVLVATGAGVLALAGLAFAGARGITGTVSALSDEAARLTAAAERGDLATRAEPARVPVEFRPVVEGMNRAVDAFERPIALAVRISRAFGHGEVPPRIAEDYAGAFDEIKRGWNQVIDATNMRAADLEKLIAAAQQGDLKVRADAGKYAGYNGKLVVGLNGILERIDAPIHEAIAALQRLAHRDLTARMTGEYAGDYARMKDAVNATAESLAAALAQVQQSAVGVTGAAAEIASSSQSVAAGASQQASTLEETSSSLESMASMVKTSADNAQQASALAQSARATAADGASAMDEMAGAMEKIRAASEGTSQIIKDINEIAFQTNLLALNAAVEAARAGAAGRGFAVVAEEVRSLALRSKEAANKTEALIRESVKMSGEGDATAKLVSGKLSEITGMVGKVTDIVAEIAAAAREQAAGIDQVTNAVGQMNKVTQQNAANSEQSSSAAVELSSQAEELTSLVKGFTLGHDLARARAPAPAPRAPAKAIRKAVVRPAPAAKKNGSNGHAGNGLALRPEDVIPLDGDPDFKDF